MGTNLGGKNVQLPGVPMTRRAVLSNKQGISRLGLFSSVTCVVVFQTQLQFSGFKKAAATSGNPRSCIFLLLTLRIAARRKPRAEDSLDSMKWYEPSWWIWRLQPSACYFPPYAIADVRADLKKWWKSRSLPAREGMLQRMSGRESVGTGKRVAALRQPPKPSRGQAPSGQMFDAPNNTQKTQRGRCFGITGSGLLEQTKWHL